MYFRLRNLNRSKNDQRGACLATARSRTRALVLRLVWAPAQLRRTRRLLGTDGEKHMHEPSKIRE